MQHGVQLVKRICTLQVFVRIEPCRQRTNFAVANLCVCHNTVNQPMQELNGGGEDAVIAGIIRKVIAEPENILTFFLINVVILDGCLYDRDDL